jgi:hypothetical protein
MARTHQQCPKCGKNNLRWETSRGLGPRLWCFCGYSKELGGQGGIDKMKWAQALLKSIDRNIDKLTRKPEKLYTKEDEKRASE